MDNVTRSPCEGAVHRLQMLRQVTVLTPPFPMLRVLAQAPLARRC